MTLACAHSAEAGERSHPLDCLPDRVVRWAAALPDPGSRFGAPFVPGVVLGPPGASSALVGSVTVASLGPGGQVVLAFDQTRIEDRPGPDFIVFENAFFRGVVPTAEGEEFGVFAEPAIVEVSADGVAWHRFPFDEAALAAAAGEGGADDIDRALFLQLAGLAGIAPTFTGDWIVPDVRDQFDLAGTGGLSGAGGDAFDLADVGLAEARYVRLTDVDLGIGFPGAAEGFDLDAVVVIHGRPVTPTTTDTDGDGLSDAEETAIYGTDPTRADSDGDDVDDGREVAGCSDPSELQVVSTMHREPRLWLEGAACTRAVWTFMGSGLVYDLLRGDPSQLAALRAVIDLGPTVCLEDDATTPAFSCDAAVPGSGEAFFYLVRVDGERAFGRSSGLVPRETSGSCP